MKIEVKIAKIEMSIEKECSCCHRMKPLAEFGANPRTRDLFVNCEMCRAWLRAKPRIGRLVLDHDGITWKVDAYTHHPEYPYTLRRYVNGEVRAEWLTNETTVKAMLLRARKEPDRVKEQS